MQFSRIRENNLLSMKLKEPFVSLDPYVPAVQISASESETAVLFVHA